MVGGGIVGCAAAYHLAKRGIAVSLFEKGNIAGEQSSRNWGFVRQQGRDPAELPMMMGCNAMWQTLEKELGADLHWRQGGNLRVIQDESQRAPYAAWAEIAREHGLKTRLLDESETARLLPGLATPVKGALYTANDGQADPGLVAPAFARAAAGLGADIQTRCAVLELETSNGAVSSVVTEKGRVPCATVICAAGAWTSRLTRAAGLRIPQLWLRASVGYTTPGRPWTPLSVWMPGVAFRQGHDGGFNIAYGGRYKHDVTLDSFRFLRDFRLCLKQFRRSIDFHVNASLLEDLRGSLNRFDSHRTLDPSPVRGVLEQALENFQSSFPAYRDLRFARTWAGYIDGTPDMLPVIDRLDDPAGLVLATGFSGHGFGLGPVSGLVASQLALYEKPTYDLHAFRYSRFHEGRTLEPRGAV